MSYLGTTKIGKMYLGNTGIAKAYLGDDLVFQKGGGSSAIPYIRGGGSNGPYIDTGITADNTVKVIVWARNWGPGAGQLLGCREGATQNTFVLATFTGSARTGSIQLAYGQSDSTYVDDQFHNLGYYRKYEYYQGTLKIDDVVVGSAPTAVFSNSLNIHIIGFNNNGTHSSPTLPIDICKVEIWKGGVLVRYMTPVETPSVGLYDAVTDTVFTNAGNGSLTYGTFDLSGYTELPYVECQSSAYIDTGIKGTYSLPIVTKFRPGGSTAAYRWILGVRTTSSSGRCEFGLGTSTDLNKAYYFNYNTAQNVVYSTESQTGNDLVWIKSNNESKLYKNNTSLGSATGATGSSFTTDNTIYLGILHNGSTTSGAFIGRIYYAGFGNQGSFLPMEHNGVAGFYDMYNDTFHPSISGNDFVAGTN